MSIATAISALQSASSDIASAITAKGVTVPSGSGFDDYASLIGQISTGGGGGTLPYDAEVEYIAASGTQYVNTGIVPTLGSTKIFIDCQFTGDYSTTQIIVGYGSAYRKYVANLSSYYGLGGSGTQKLTVTSSTRVPLVISFSSNTTTDMSCGLSTCTASNSTALTADTPITLFMGGTGYYSKAKIYSCKIYTGQTLTLDLIPVRVGTVGKFYDKVSGNFFNNAGSGSFLYGSDV